MISPPCQFWCKTTDFARKNQAQMSNLTKNRAIQTQLMTKLNDIIRIIMDYGGHVLIENPTHSKYWKQTFF